MDIDFTTQNKSLVIRLSFGLTQDSADDRYALASALTAETNARTLADTAETSARTQAIAAEATARDAAIAAHAATAASTYETKQHALANFARYAWGQIMQSGNPTNVIKSTTKDATLNLDGKGIDFEFDDVTQTLTIDASSIISALAGKLSTSTATSTYQTIAGAVATYLKKTDAASTYAAAAFAAIVHNSASITASTKGDTITLLTAGGIEISINANGKAITFDTSNLKTMILARIEEPTKEGTAGQVLVTDGNGGRTWATVNQSDVIKFTVQSLTSSQKAQARTNIDAVDTSTIGALNQLTTENKSSVVAAINELANHGNIQVTVTLTPSAGTIDWSGTALTVKVGGMSEGYTVNVTSAGTAYMLIPRGASFNLTYPGVLGYTTPSAENYTADANIKAITKIYQESVALEDVARSVILEESSNPAWTLGCQPLAIDEILNTYGSYIIDPVHKKYARLKSTNGAQFADGTAWDGTYGEAFRRFPKAFYDVINNNDNKPVLYLSKRGISAKYFEECWIGTYKGNVSDNKLHSRPGVAATGSLTMSNFWAKAQALGTDFGIVNYFEHCYLNALHLCKYGNANSENTMGKGLQDAGSAYYSTTTGSTIALGDATGQAPHLTSGHNQNRLFGIEALAGQQWEFRPNIRFSGTNAIVYKGNQVSNTIDEGHADYVRKFTRGMSNGYIKNMVLGNYFDLIMQTSGGSSSTYWCDYGYVASGGELLLVGGNSYNGSYCGLSASHSPNAFGTADAHFGARLAFRGDISEYELVSGQELAYINQ